jgi:hypothetical protein
MERKVLIHELPSGARVAILIWSVFATPVAGGIIRLIAIKPSQIIFITVE